MLLGAECSSCAAGAPFWRRWGVISGDSRATVGRRSGDARGAHRAPLDRQLGHRRWAAARAPPARSQAPGSGSAAASSDRSAAGGGRVSPMRGTSMKRLASPTPLRALARARLANGVGVNSMRRSQWCRRGMEADSHGCRRARPDLLGTSQIRLLAESWAGCAHDRQNCEPGRAMSKRFHGRVPVRTPGNDSSTCQCRRSPHET